MHTQLHTHTDSHTSARASVALLCELNCWITLLLDGLSQSNFRSIIMTFTSVWMRKHKLRLVCEIFYLMRLSGRCPVCKVYKISICITRGTLTLNLKSTSDLVFKLAIIGKNNNKLVLCVVQWINIYVFNSLTFVSYEIGRRDRRTVEYVDERKRMDEHIDRWMNEQLNRWSDGQTDRGTHQRLWRWTMGKKNTILA